MTGPLTAGEPLAPAGRDKPRPGTRLRAAGAWSKIRRSGARAVLVRTARGLFGAMLGVLLLVGLAGAVGGYMAYAAFQRRPA